MIPITIGFIGAPGVGKSTLAYGLVYEFKHHGYEVELVPELMKQKVMFGNSNNNPDLNIATAIDQKSLELKYRELPINYLVCETTLYNPYIYATIYNMGIEQIQYLNTLQHSVTYDYLIFVRIHHEQEYKQFGRCESYEDAKKLDTYILNTIDLLHKGPIITVTNEISSNQLYQKILASNS